MDADASFKKNLCNVSLYALVALFLVPASTWLFVQDADAGKLALWTLAGNFGVLAAVLALAGLAFADRRCQYFSFVVGWNLLAAASALQMVLQGAMVVAFFLNLYTLELAILTAIGAVVAAFFGVVRIYRRPCRGTVLEGEPIAEKDAPALWAHVRELARKIGTAAPQHIVAGIDANFFVEGRSLFVSLPLLRVLDRDEADAVLAHELAHVTALSARLAQYDAYCRMLCEAKLTIAVFYVMRMYRLVFELALERERRRRELLADRAAATVVSPQALAASLVKRAAYSCYRAEIEHTLFEHGARQFGALGIAQGVAVGFARYAASPLFAEAMRSPGMPALAERMRNVGYVIEEEAFAAIAATARGDTWLADLPGAAQMEARLWHGYEHGFDRAHGQSLACRHEAANDGEIRHFPPQSFVLKGRKALRLGHAGMTLPGEEQPMPWDDIADLKVENGGFGTAAVLQVVHPAKRRLGAKTTKVALAGLKEGEKERLLRVLAGYRPLRA